MTLLFWIKILVAVATLGFGALSIVRPSAAESFTGLAAAGPRGISEIRSILGGVFVGLAIAVFIYRSPHAFGTLGIAYLGIAVVRAASIFVDRASTASNWISLISEVAFGVLLLI